MIEVREAGREEVFVPDAEMITCTFEQFNALRNVIKHTPGVTVYQQMDPRGHRIIRHFPVPSITTLKENPHG